VSAGLLLGSDLVELYPPAADADEHGWALPGTAPYWTGTGCLQLAAGSSDPRASSGGGAGPFDPRAVPDGMLYVPPDCPLAEGSAALIRGQWWSVSQVRLITDPTAEPGGGVSCIAAMVTAAPDDGGDDA
jgi:hypothetical protein